MTCSSLSFVCGYFFIITSHKSIDIISRYMCSTINSIQYSLNSHFTVPSTRQQIWCLRRKRKVQWVFRPKILPFDQRHKSINTISKYKFSSSTFILYYLHSDFIIFSTRNTNLQLLEDIKAISMNIQVIFLLFSHLIAWCLFGLVSIALLVIIAHCLQSQKLYQNHFNWVNHCYSIDKED